MPIEARLFDAAGEDRDVAVDDHPLAGLANDEILWIDVLAPDDHDMERLAGVFDWDLAGPSAPLHELAFLAWTGVPLWGDPDPAVAAPRLAAISGACGDGALTPRRILRAVPGRLRAMYDRAIELKRQLRLSYPGRAQKKK